MLATPVKIKGSKEGVNLFHRKHKIINVKELGAMQRLCSWEVVIIGIKSLFGTLYLWMMKEGRRQCIRFMDTKGAV